MVRSRPLIVDAFAAAGSTLSRRPVTQAACLVDCLALVGGDPLNLRISSTWRPKRSIRVFDSWVSSVSSCLSYLCVISIARTSRKKEKNPEITGNNELILHGYPEYADEKISHYTCRDMTTILTPSTWQLQKQCRVGAYLHSGGVFFICYQ